MFNSFSNTAEVWMPGGTCAADQKIWHHKDTMLKLFSSFATTIGEAGIDERTLHLAPEKNMTILCSPYS